MLQDIDLDKITDGKLYKRDDYVKITCDNCKGCSDCCRTVGDSILLDPLDIYNLSKVLSKSFAEMMESEIEIRMVDNLVIPNIIIQDGCKMLDENGRCTIHAARPGYCRLFPLGRLYDDDGNFDYIIQINECDYPNKGEIKVSDWLGIENLDKYEQYIKDWHHFTKNISEYLDECDDETLYKKFSWLPLRLFLEPPYDPNRDFYEQFYERMRKIRNK